MATLAGVSKTLDFDTKLRQYFRRSVFTHYFIRQTPNKQTQKCLIPCLSMCLQAVLNVEALNQRQESEFQAS
jgi:hypothetical protein